MEPPTRPAVAGSSQLPPLRALVDEEAQRLDDPDRRQGGRLVPYGRPSTRSMIPATSAAALDASARLPMRRLGKRVPGPPGARRLTSRRVRKPRPTSSAQPGVAPTPSSRALSRFARERSLIASASRSRSDTRSPSRPARPSACDLSGSGRGRSPAVAPISGPSGFARARPRVLPRCARVPVPPVKPEGGLVGPAAVRQPVQPIGDVHDPLPHPGVGHRGPRLEGLERVARALARLEEQGPGPLARLRHLGVDRPPLGVALLHRTQHVAALGRDPLALQRPGPEADLRLRLAVELGGALEVAGRRRLEPLRLERAVVDALGRAAPASRAALTCPAQASRHSSSTALSSHARTLPPKPSGLAASIARVVVITCACGWRPPSRARTSWTAKSATMPRATICSATKPRSSPSCASRSSSRGSASWVSRASRASLRFSLASTAFHSRSRSAIQTGAPSGSTISLWTTPRLAEKSNAWPAVAGQLRAGAVGGRADGARQPVPASSTSRSAAR